MFDDSARPHRRVVLAVALAALAASAGCAGLLGGDATPSGPQTGTDGGTATPTQTGTGVPPDADLPPGVADNGSVDPVALAAGHARALANTSYTSRAALNRTVQTGSGTRESWVVQTARVSDRGTYRSTYRTGGVQTFTEVTWGNRSVAVGRVTSSAGTQYRRKNPRKVRRSLPGQGLLRQFLRLGEYSVSSVDREAGRVTLTATSPAPDGGLQNASMESYAGTVVLDMQGRIRELNVSTTITAEGQTVTLGVEYVLSAVGETSVRKPSWVAEALSKTATEGRFREHNR